MNNVTNKKFFILRRLSLSLFIVFCILISVRSASAQAGLPVSDSLGTTSTILQTVGDYIKQAWEKYVWAEDSALRSVAATAYRQGITYFLDKVAKDTATWVASGGKGQQPLFVTQGWGAYLQDAGDGAAGKIIDTISAEGLLGFNLCNPRLDVLLRINLGISKFQQQRPRCTFSQLMNNWDREITQRDFLSNFQLSFDANQSPLGASLVVNGIALEQTALAKQAAEKARLESGGFKAVTDFVTENVETPGNLVAETLFDAFGGANNQYLIATGDAVADAVNNFTSSVTSQLLNNLLKKGLGGGSGPGSTRRLGGTQSLTNPGSSVTSEGIGGARLRLAKDVAPSFNTPGQYDALSQLASCRSASKPSPNTCAITQNMRTAITQRLTVQEAIEKGLFNDGGAFGFTTRAPKSVEPSYTDGIPYRTILLLRKYRIVPVGWELAARYIENFGDANKSQWTLKQIVAEYNNDKSEFYRLIDPNWAFVPPDTYCKLQGPGPEIITTESVPGSDVNKDGKYDGLYETPPSVKINRAENYCADEQSCIQRDEKGNCKFYGYCTEEKRLWNFGTKSCLAEHNTCTTLTSSAGANVSYLLNSVSGAAVCNEDPVPDGCTQYSRVKNITEDPEDKTDDWSVAVVDSVFLNEKAKDCAATDAGCRAFIRPGYSQASDALTGANLIENPSFEAIPIPGAGNTQKLAGGWVSVPATNVQQSQSDAEDGQSYYRTNGVPLTYSWVIGQVSSDVFGVGPNLSGRPLTISFSARNAVVVGGVPGNFRLTTNAEESFSRLFDYTGTPATLNNTWQRYSASLQLPEGLSERASFEIRMELPNNTDFDMVKLEVGATATGYSSYGSGASNATVHLKRAPDSFSAEDLSNPYHGTGNSCRPTRPADNQNDKPDAAACKPYARYCLPEEAGCMKYVPKNGTSAITSVRGDSCPGQCVGYDTYTQSKTFFEESKFVDLIPTSAKKCAASRVGCDEFTNLDAATNGGETKEYYQEIRYCQEPGGDDDGVYYTWEGSDTTGYQLKVFTLKRAADNAPCTHLKWSADGQTSTCVDNTIPGTEVATNICNETTYGADPDCRQFYDANGAVSYRLFSKTISVTDNCHPYRKTQSTERDCDNSGGYWETDTSSCRYQAVPKEGRSCAASAAGCREYRGGTSGSYRVIMSDNYEGGAGGWQGGRLSAVSNKVGGHSYELTGDSIEKEVSAVQDAGRALVPDTEYKVTFDARQQGNSATAVQLNVFAVSGTCPNNQEPCASQKVTPLFTSPVTLAAGASAGWASYQTEPKIIDFDISEGSTPQVKIRITRTTGEPVYVDNVTLQSNVNTYYLIKGSSQIPASCNAPVAYLGCQSYKVSDGKTKNIYQFGEACHEKVVGCEAVIDTQNTTTGPEAPFKQTYRGNYSVPADTVDYVVNTADKQCRGEAQGCEALGVPTKNNDRAACFAGLVGDCNSDGEITRPEFYQWFSGFEAFGACPALDTNRDGKISQTEKTLAANNTITEFFDDAVTNTDDINELFAYFQSRNFVGLQCNNWDNKYRLNNPDSYEVKPGILCRADQVQCTRFTDAQGNVSRFKDPDGQVCEYRADKPTAGWYIVDPQGVANASAPDCDQDFPAGVLPRTHKDGGVAQPKTGWVGVCPAASSSCREIVDPRSDDGSDLLKNSSFILGDADLPSDWSKFDSSSSIPPDNNAHEVGVGTGSARDGIRQTVKLRAQRDYILSAQVKAGGSDVNAAAYIGLSDIAGSAAGSCVGNVRGVDGGRLYSFISPKTTYEQFSVRFYVTTKVDVTCDVVLGQAADFIALEDVPGTFTETPLRFNETSLRETRLHYQLTNGFDEKSCNGTVNNANCVLVDDRGGVSGAKPVNFAADTSPLSESKGTPDGQSRPEYTCLSVGNAKLCRGTTQACTTNADCQLHFNANKIVRVTPDRECGAWLSCKTTRKIVANGVTRNICLEVKGCEEIDENGVCTRETPDVADKNITFSKTNIDLLRNRSGYSKVGFDWGNDRLLQGYLPPQYMRETAQALSLYNGDFESSINGRPTGWSMGDNSERLRIIDNPALAEKAGLIGSYPVEGIKLLEVNANQAPPQYNGNTISNNVVPVANFTGLIQAAPGTRYTISALLNTLHFTGAATEIRVYEYKKATESLGVAYPGGTGVYHSLLNLGSGFGWTRLTDTFTTTEDTRFIRVQLTWETVGDTPGGFWHIDDLAIRPALGLQKNEAAEAARKVCRGDTRIDCTADDNKCAPNKGPCAHYVAPDFPALSYERGNDNTITGYHNVSQSCQLYPRADALACRYSDSTGVRHRGKRGYCLEWDPSNANYCLQWWPVDSVVGEDIEEDRAGYDDRYPLYMCTETVDGFVPASYFHGVHYNRNPNNGGVQDPWDQKERERFIEGKSTVVLDLYNSDIGQKPGVGNVATGGIVDKAIDEDCDLRTGGAGCEIALKISSAINAGGQNECISGVYLSNTSAEMVDGPSEDDLFVGSVLPEQDKLFWFDVKTSRSAGSFRYLKLRNDTTPVPGANRPQCDKTTISEFWIRPNFSCTNLIRVVDETAANKAYQSRLASGSLHPIEFVSGGGAYTRATPVAPYGGIVAPPPTDDPTLWDGLDTVGQQPLFAYPSKKDASVAQAGAAYGCRSLPAPRVPDPLNPDLTVPALTQPQCATTFATIGNIDHNTAVRNYLSQLFVESYGAWKWTQTCSNGTCSGSYQDDPDAEQLRAPSKSCIDNLRPSSATAEACGVSPVVSSIALSQSVVHEEGSVTLSFTALVDPDQAPIVQYIVDWGDGTQTPVSGVRLQSRPSSNNAIVLSHEYSYESLRRNPPPGVACNATDCTVRPRVQVLDNWGWCNKELGITDPSNPLRGKQGFYAFADDPDESCSRTNSAAWATSGTAITINSQ